MYEFLNVIVFDHFITCHCHSVLAALYPYQFCGGGLHGWLKTEPGRHSQRPETPLSPWRMKPGLYANRFTSFTVLPISL